MRACVFKTQSSTNIECLSQQNIYEANTMAYTSRMQQIVEASLSECKHFPILTLQALNNDACNGIHTSVSYSGNGHTKYIAQPGTLS